MPANDYTRYRAQGVIPYAVEDIIGRQEGDNVHVTSMSVTGVHSLLPDIPLVGRTYMKVVNEGAVDVAIVTASGVVAATGFTVDASGGTWEDNVSANLYIVSTGAASTVKVYERASK